MNMKKSIAGVMAGAMAVSAMATTTSAWTGGNADQAQIVLSYDLNEYGLAFEDTVVTVETTYAKSTYQILGLDSTAGKNTTVVTFGGKLAAVKDASYDLVSVELDAKSVGGKTSDNVVYYSKKLLGTSLPSDLSNEAVNVDDFTALTTTKTTSADGAAGNTYAFNITFATKDAIAANPGAYGLGGSFVVDGFKLDAGEQKKRFYTEQEAYNAMVDQPKYATLMVIKDETYTWKDANGNTYADWQVEDIEGNKGRVYSQKPTSTIVKSTIGTDAKFTAVQVGGQYAAAITVNGVTYYVAEDVNDPTTEIPSVGAADELTTDINKACHYGTAELAEAVTVTAAIEVEKSVVTDPGAYVEVTLVGNKDGEYYLLDDDRNYLMEKINTGRYGFETYTVTKTYYTNTKNWNGDWNYTGDAWMYSDASAGIADMAIGRNVINAAQGNGVAIAKPMRSTLGTPANVMAALRTRKDAWNDKIFYTEPQAVLNDIVANNENVSFTFTTSASYVDNRAEIEVAYDGQAYDAGTKRAKIKNPAGGIETISGVDATQKGGKWYIANPYYGVAYADHDKKGDMWYNPYFHQHLYNTGTYGLYYFTAQGPNGTQTTYDQFGSYSSSWNTNLFSGGLVVNSNWTMQLSDTDAFEWGDQTLTFYWDSIKEGKVSNAKDFIQSVLLYTPVEWFWDKLDVAVGAAVVEEVVAGAGQEDDATEVVEEEAPVEEEIFEEEVVEEEVFEEEVEEEEVVEEDFEEEVVEEEVEIEVEEEEVVIEEVEVEAPVTGNASVALAVIPVALAAAAVVAKKRN